MKREVCPNCGGVLVAESLGWKCKSCRGFISLQDGKFYEYVEKPFMPPQTNADRIRAMSDEELAEFLEGEEWMCESYDFCHECPRCEMSSDCCSVLDWLRQPVKEVSVE